MQEVHDAPPPPKAPKGGGLSLAERMMAKMGWKKGQGLGKQEQGVTSALEVASNEGTGRGVIKRSEGVVGGAAAAASAPQPRQEESRVVCLANMVGAGEVDAVLRDETKEECEMYGKVLGVRIFERDAAAARARPDDAVRIFVRFADTASALRARNAIDGRFFGGRTVRAGVADVRGSPVLCASGGWGGTLAALRLVTRLPHGARTPSRSCKNALSPR